MLEQAEAVPGRRGPPPALVGCTRRVLCSTDAPAAFSASEPARDARVPADGVNSRERLEALDGSDIGSDRRAVGICHARLYG